MHCKFVEMEFNEWGKSNGRIVGTILPLRKREWKSA
jgi:hypothetical protein